MIVTNTNSENTRKHNSKHNNLNSKGDMLLLVEITNDNDLIEIMIYSPKTGRE